MYILHPQGTERLNFLGKGNNMSLYDDVKKFCSQTTVFHYYQEQPGTDEISPVKVDVYAAREDDNSNSKPGNTISLVHVDIISRKYPDNDMNHGFSHNDLPWRTCSATIQYQDKRTDYLQGEAAYTVYAIMANIYEQQMMAQHEAKNLQTIKAMHNRLNTIMFHDLSFDGLYYEKDYKTTEDWKYEMFCLYAAYILFAEPDRTDDRDGWHYFKCNIGESSLSCSPLFPKGMEKIIIKNKPFYNIVLKQEDKPDFTITDDSEFLNGFGVDLLSFYQIVRSYGGFKPGPLTQRFIQSEHALRRTR